MNVYKLRYRLSPEHSWQTAVYSEGIDLENASNYLFLHVITLYRLVGLNKEQSLIEVSEVSNE